MAYAAITSLMSTIQQSMQLTACNLQSFYDKLESFIAILEKHRKIADNLEALTSLEAQIAELAYRAEDEVDSKSIEVLRAKKDSLRGVAFWKLYCFLKQAVEHIDSAMDKWMALQRIRYVKSKDLEVENLTLASTSQHALEPENQVGHENEYEMLVDQLARGARELEVVSIVGMGGIGKTTLAYKIYNDPFIMSCFDIRAKATVSQEYCARNVLLGLLSSICRKADEPYEEQDDWQLADRLQKILKGKKYLVVIDDIWTNGAWDDTKLCFPDFNLGSRILMTTRNMEVAKYASSGEPPYQMRLMNFDESWSLLYETVFVKDYFLPEFEQLGKHIALKSGGLPLAVVVVAGLLSKIGKALDKWKRVAENVSSVVSTDLNVQCMRVLALSYHHLLHHLKPCFLYFAIFPEDKLSFVNKLVKLWAAEGFLKIDEMKNMEQVAKKCIKDLVDRSLIFIHKASSFDEKIKACGMHDVIRELSLRGAQNINFVNVIMDNRIPCEESRHFSTKRVRISINLSNPILLPISCLCFVIMSHVLFSFLLKIPQELNRFEVLRVPDLASQTLHAFPSCIVELFHLRYLALSVYSNTNDRGIYIPPSISSLQYLQTLVLKSPSSIPAS